MPEVVAACVLFASALLTTDLPAWLLFGFDPGCPRYFYPGYVRLGALEIGSLALLYLVFSRGSLKVGRKDVFIWALGGMWLFSWASVLWARSPSSAVCGSTTLSFYLLWAFLLARGGLDEKRLTKALLLAGVAAGTMCAWDYCVVWVRSGERPFRFEMPATNANELPGLVLLPFFLAADGALKSARAKDLRGLARYSALALPMAFALWASRSRSGAVAVAVGAVVLTAIRCPPRVRKAVAAGALLCAVLAVSSLAVPSVRRAIDPPLSPTTPGVRLVAWKWAVRAFLRGPLVGHGRGSFSLVCREYADASDLLNPYLRGRTAEAHNFFLQEAAETGLAGVALAALVFGVAVVSGWRKKSAFLPGLVSLLVLASFNPIMSRWEGQAFVWTGAALCVQAAVRGRRELIAWKKALAGFVCACLCIIPLIDQAAHLEMGEFEALHSSGDVRGALTRAVKAQGSFHYLLNRRAALAEAELLARMGEKADAREAVSDHLAAAPSDVALALTAARASDGAEALPPLLRALRYEPYSELVERELARRLRDVDEDELAALAALAALEGGVELPYLRALRHESVGNREEALRLARRAGHPRARLLLARVLLKAEKRAEAAKLLDEIIAREPRLSEAYVLRAQTRTDPGGAIAELRVAHAVSLSSDTALALVAVLDGDGRTEEAKEFLEGVLRTVVRADPRTTPLWIELARLYGKTGDAAGLAALVKKARFYAKEDFAERLERAARMLY